MPTVEVKETIQGGADAVYNVLSKMDDFPTFMSNVESVEIRETGEGYAVSEWTARLQGKKFHWVERDEFFPQRRQIVFRQVQGDLKVFAGRWQVDPVTAAESRVTLVTEFEFGIPMLATLLNPVARYALRQNALGMLAGVQQAIAVGPAK